MRWAIIHPPSGAIVMVTTSRSAQAPAHLERRPAPAGVDPRTHWWTGWSFGARIDAPIMAAPDGAQIYIGCADDAWLSYPDGSIGIDRTIIVPDRRSRVSLVGKYRGEVWIEPGDLA